MLARLTSKDRHVLNINEGLPVVCMCQTYNSLREVERVRRVANHIKDRVERGERFVDLFAKMRTMLADEGVDFEVGEDPIHPELKLFYFEGRTGDTTLGLALKHTDPRWCDPFVPKNEDDISINGLLVRRRDAGKTN
jgi:hypothetical protein